MKPLAQLFFIFQLISCGGESAPKTSKSAIVDPLAKNPKNLAETQISIKALRDSASFTIGYENAPEQSSQFRLCELKAENNECQIKKSGKAADKGAVNITIGSRQENISLIDLLTQSYEFRLTDNQEKILYRKKLEFTPALINQSIQYIKASKTADNDRFGAASAISRDGKTLAIGAPGQSSASANINNSSISENSGAVFIYSKTEQGWVESAFIKAASIYADDSFGSSIALSDTGDRLAVGAPGNDSSEQNAGAMFIFDRKNNKEWQQVSFFEPFAAKKNLQMGSEVALSGDGLFVAFSAGLSNNAVEIFYQREKGWTPLPRILPKNIPEFDKRNITGFRLAFSQNGQYFAISNVNPIEQNTQGQVVIFNRENNQFKQTATLKAANAKTALGFGASLALSFDAKIAAIGTFKAEAVYIFEQNPNKLGWRFQRKIEDSNQGSEFGLALSLSDDGQKMAVFAQKTAKPSVGISLKTPEGISASWGAISLFDLEQDEAKQVLFWQPSSPFSYREFGSSLSLSGDGSMLLATTTKENANARGINQEASSNEETKENSGAAWLLSLGEKATIKGDDGSKPPNFSSMLETSVELQNASITLSWEQIPKGAEGFVVCALDTSKPNNCKDLETGAAEDKTVTVSFAATDISLEALLAQSVMLFFYDSDNGLISSNEIAIEKPLIDALVQYIKSPTPDSVFLNADEQQSDELGDWFGLSLALSGDGSTLVVGSDVGSEGINGSASNIFNVRSGSVYIFTKTEQGWLSPQFLKHRHFDSEDHFGYSVAIDENASTLLVAAPYEDTKYQGIGWHNNNKAQDSGAVFVFTKDSEGIWQEKHMVNAQEPSQFFGHALTISADGLTFAAAGIKNAKPFIEIYRKDLNSNWQFFHSMTVASKANHTISALSISEYGNVIAAGVNTNSAKDYTDPDNREMLNSGAVFVFNRVNKSYQQGAFIKASMPVKNAYFGQSVSLSGNGRTLAVGAPGTNKAYLFDLIGLNWQERYIITEKDLQTTGQAGKKDQFGHALALSKKADKLVVTNNLDDSGAKGINVAGINVADDAKALTNSGAAYLYKLSKQNAKLIAYLKAPVPNAKDKFGSSVAISHHGNSLVVGAPFEDSASEEINGEPYAEFSKFINRGAVYQYPF